MKALDGGVKVHVLLVQTLFGNPDILLLDEPTNHLDLEAITALNDGLKKYSEVILLGSHDHELNSSVANRVIELTPNGMIDSKMTFDEYFSNPRIQEKRDKMYDGHQRPIL